MPWIDWLYLDWYVISAWIFGILLALYVAVRLKNYFYRWSAAPPTFLQPFVVHQEKTSEKGMNQTKIMLEGDGEKFDPVAIWVFGRCPRFLRNIAYSLCLHANTVYVYEVKSRAGDLYQLEFDKELTNQIFYRSAGQFGNEIEERAQNKITILLAPKIPRDLKNHSGIKKYLIMGRRISQKQAQPLEKAGNFIIYLKGGCNFRGWELALLGELIAIFKKHKGTAQ